MKLPHFNSSIYLTFYASYSVGDVKKNSPTLRVIILKRKKCFQEQFLNAFHKNH